MKRRFRFTAWRTGKLLEMGEMGDFSRADFQEDWGFTGGALKASVLS